MWQLSMRGARRTPFEEVASFASIYRAAEAIHKMEPDSNGKIFFRAAVYALNEEPTFDAEVLSHLS